MVEIRWSRGPQDLRLGDEWVLPLPPGALYAVGAEMRRFLEATGNAVTGKEMLVFGAGDLAWFVVVSTAAEARGGDQSWTEESLESDGREVRIHSILRGRTLFELVSEKAGAESARRAVERILNGLRPSEAPRTPWWSLLVIPLVVVYLIRRRRAC